jgi:environmental stress-induced protein Ves
VITIYIMTEPAAWSGTLRFRRLETVWRSICSAPGGEVTLDIPDAQFLSTTLQEGLKEGPLSSVAHLFGAAMALLNGEEREQDTRHKVERIRPDEYHVRLTSV